jgi:hypothetical protein
MVSTFKHSFNFKVGNNEKGARGRCGGVGCMKWNRLLRKKEQGGVG